MSKAQTDIRTTSYDALSARPEGYQGEIDDVIAQIRSERVTKPRASQATGRTELRKFLGVPAKHESVSSGPSVELDEDPRYGEEPPAKPPFNFSLAYGISSGIVR